MILPMLLVIPKTSEQQLLHIRFVAGSGGPLLRFLLLLFPFIPVGSQFLFEEVVLEPKGDAVHDDWRDYDDEDELQGLVGLDPSDQHTHDVDQRTAQHHLYLEQQRLRNHHDHVPNHELHEPVDVAYPG
jgi:hypothetical protein